MTYNLKFEEIEMEKGYTNQTLYINLSDKQIKIKPVSDEMKEKFIGGKGFDLWLMWNSLPKDRIVEWNDPENEICIATGPLGGGTVIPGSGKSIVTTISPITGIIVDSNVGGYFGPYLKHAGFDALEIQGKADEEVIVYIDAETQKIEVMPAPEGKYNEDSHLLTQELMKAFSKDPDHKDYKQISVVSTGPGAKYTNWGMLNFSFFTAKRDWASYKQAGRGGIGTVFADKNIKALVIYGKKKFPNINPVDPDTLKKIAKEHNTNIIQHDHEQNLVREIGTGYLPEIMNEYDLLPTENYRFGKHHTLTSDQIPYQQDDWKKTFCDTKPGTSSCWVGCTLSCAHYMRNFELSTGPYKGQKVVVDGPEYETIAGCGSNWGVWDVPTVMEVNFYCDTYGLDTISVGTGIAFVMECFEAGIITKKDTDGLDLSFGNGAAGIELIHQMGRGKGFGAQVVGKGIKQMKRIFAEEYGGDAQFLQDIGMEHKGLEFSEYLTKESLAQQGGFGFALKGPQHDEAWLIFEDLVKKSMPSFSDKARALTWFPYWRTWFGLNGLCKILWNDVKPADNNALPIHDPETGDLVQARIPKHVQYYADYYTAVTGIQSTTQSIVKDSERVYNFQRIFSIRLGKGLRENDSHMPYRAMGPVTEVEYKSRQERYDGQLKTLLNIDEGKIEGMSTAERIAAIREYKYTQYTQLQNEVYTARGWTQKGCPSYEKVKELGLDFDSSIMDTIQPYFNDDDEVSIPEKVQQLD